MSANKRISSELRQLSENPVEGTKVSLVDESNLNIWRVDMDGPLNSVYAGGTFHIEVNLPSQYPFKQPVLSFKTKIYHPNVTNDNQGSICLGILRSDTWKPIHKIAEVLRLVRTVLEAPQPDDAVEASIADQFKRDRAAFDKTAREWVEKYAKGSS
ncbi:UBC-like protein [Myriangium duriaei CBS 260.36]|uniref:E2 ubiquitin-conjugating enzyme n=1 Tax=Myriangium duriaei CBS 260.36 TaxID=1168546 RepID=A0A9P4J0I7_9PEZI|nr:UBC-like protein [Myriangium duriaei CBS 260.36]